MPIKRKRKEKTKLNISKWRNLKLYSNSEYIGRILWAIVFPFFRFSPRLFFSWRSFLLRLFGAKIGEKVHIDPSVKIYLPWNLQLGDESSVGEKVVIYNLGKITIGNRATISQRAHLCGGTHDYTDPKMPLLRLPIKIGNQVWICADSFVGPNIIIGESSIVGAASVVTKNIPSWKVYAGNPAKYIKNRKLIV